MGLGALRSGRARREPVTTISSTVLASCADAWPAVASAPSMAAPARMVVVRRQVRSFMPVYMKSPPSIHPVPGLLVLSLTDFSWSRIGRCSPFAEQNSDTSDRTEERDFSTLIIVYE